VERGAGHGSVPSTRGVTLRGTITNTALVVARDQPDPVASNNSAAKTNPAGTSPNCLNGKDATTGKDCQALGGDSGEEFLVVLPNCDLEQATNQAERMRHRLHETSMLVDGRELQVSASFGVTISDGSERSSDVFVRVADEALYRAKANGRNRVWSLTLEQSALHSA